MLFPQLSKQKSECQCLVVCAIAGYYAYNGFLIMEHTYNNAVVHAFVRLMVDESREKKKRRSHFWGVPLDEDNSDEIEEQLESGKLFYLTGKCMTVLQFFYFFFSQCIHHY